MLADPVDNERELTGNDALRLASESGMEKASRGNLWLTDVGDLIRFARLVRAGWKPERPAEKPWPFTGTSGPLTDCDMEDAPSVTGDAK